MKNIKKLVLALSSAIVLAACGTAPVTPPNTEIFKADNVYGTTLPADATVVSNAAFEAAITSGEGQIVSSKSLGAEVKATDDKFTQDQEFINSVSEIGVKQELNQIVANDAQATKTPNGDTISNFMDNSGQEQQVTFLGARHMLNQAIQGYQAERNSENLLNIYTIAYETAPERARVGLATPESLKGKPFSAIRNELDNLEQNLAKEMNADPVFGAKLSTNQDVKPQIVPGNGNDGNCTPSSTGVYGRFTWKLKRFTTPVKQQGRRGTCWAFAAVAAMESQAQVVLNGFDNINLSEQFLVAHHKRNGSSSWPSSDGDSANAAVNKAVGVKIPFENAWTYNPSWSRTGNATPFASSCNSYTGSCSNTTHQSSILCTKVNGANYCYYEKIVSPPNAAWLQTNSQVNNFWSRGGSGIPVNTLRSVLANGYTVIGAFDVYSGFMSPGASGFITNTSTASYQGGHAIAIIGYISNETLRQPAGLPNAPAAAGGGYLIIKNSWGCGYGDGGYVYYPIAFANQTFRSLSFINFPGSPRSTRWQQN
jgi:C1A family cysteine protease